jgi:hypothetical protein
MWDRDLITTIESCTCAIAVKDDDDAIVSSIVWFPASMVLAKQQRAFEGVVFLVGSA